MPVKPAIRQQLLDLVRREIFRNFAIVTGAGIRYDITDPDAMAFSDEMIHYYPPKQDRSLHIPYNHISTIEELASPKLESKSKRGSSPGAK